MYINNIDKYRLSYMRPRYTVRYALEFINFNKRRTRLHLRE